VALTNESGNTSHNTRVLDELCLEFLNFGFELHVLNLQFLVVLLLQGSQPLLLLHLSLGPAALGINLEVVGTQAPPAYRENEGKKWPTRRAGQDKTLTASVRARSEYLFDLWCDEDFVVLVQLEIRSVCLYLLIDPLAESFADDCVVHICEPIPRERKSIFIGGQIKPQQFERIEELWPGSRETELNNNSTQVPAKRSRGNYIKQHPTNRNQIQNHNANQRQAKQTVVCQPDPSGPGPSTARLAALTQRRPTSLQRKCLSAAVFFLGSEFREPDWLREQGPRPAQAAPFSGTRPETCSRRSSALTPIGVFLHEHVVALRRSYRLS